jgi:IS5 family transposase
VAPSLRSRISTAQRNASTALPDATTIWLFREALAEARLIDKLFSRFGQHLEAKGYIALAAGSSCPERQGCAVD